MDTARHVIKRILNPCFLSSMASYDVLSTASHVIVRILHPRFLSYMASYDVASIIHQSLVDGVVRVLRRCADSWKLIGCVKPHTAAVTAAAYSPSGATLATAAADATAGGFFRTITRPTLISSSSPARLHEHSLSG